MGGRHGRVGGGRRGGRGRRLLGGEHEGVQLGGGRGDIGEGGVATTRHHVELGLRHEQRGVARGVDGRHPIILAVQQVERLAPLAQGLLGVGQVGIEDRLGVVTVPRQEIGRAEVRRQARDAPEEGAMEAVDEFVDERVAHHLELLGAGRGNQAERTHAAGIGAGQFQRGDPAEPLAHHVILLDPVVLDQGGDHRGVRLHRVTGHIAGRSMETGQESLDDRDPRVFRQRFAEPAALVVPRHAMQVDHHGRTEPRQGAELGLRLLAVDAMEMGAQGDLPFRLNHLVTDQVKRRYLDRGAFGETLDGAEDGELRRQDQED